MTRDKFQVVGHNLSGHGVAFDVAMLVSSETSEKVDPTERGKRLVEVVEVVYREGRESVLLSCDDRFDLHCAVEALRALAVIVGANWTGDRYRCAADTIARLLETQREET